MKGPMRLARMLVMLLVVFLSINTLAAAETAAPDIGCNSQGCSIWLLEYAWPDVLEINAFEFVRFKIDVNQTHTQLSGSVQYLGVFCMIPYLAISRACPSGAGVENLSSTLTPPTPGVGLGGGEMHSASIYSGVFLIDRPSGPAPAG